MDSCYCIWPSLMNFVLLGFGILCAIGVADGTLPPPPPSHFQRPPAPGWPLSPPHHSPGLRVPPPPSRFSPPSSGGRGPPPPHSRLPTPNPPSSNGNRLSPPRHPPLPPQGTHNSREKAAESHFKRKGANLGKKVGLAFVVIAVILQFAVVGFLVFEKRQLLKMRD